MSTLTLVTALVENRPDMLSHTVSLLHRRAFQLDSVLFGGTDSEQVARLTFAVAGQAAEGERLERELGRLLYVLQVDNLTERPAVVRELALIKVEAEAGDREQVARLCELFRARVVDVAPCSMVAEITGDGAKIDGFLTVLRPFGIVEMVRTGPLALARAEHALAAELDSAWAAHTGPAVETAAHPETSASSGEEQPSPNDP